MSYLRRNIRDLTSKLIAANGGELSEEMKQALCEFSRVTSLYETCDREDKRVKSQTKRQRRRFARREADQDRRKRQEEWIEWLTFQDHEENDRYGEYYYAGFFFAGTNAFEWMDDESLDNWEAILSQQEDEQPDDFYFYQSGFYSQSDDCDAVFYSDVLSCHYSAHWWRSTKYCPDCGLRL